MPARGRNPALPFPSYQTLVKKYQNSSPSFILAVLVSYPLYYNHDKTVPNWWDNEDGLSYFGILRPIAME